MELFQYLVLQHPGHNRVFYKYSGELALCELKLASKRLSSSCSELKIEEIASVRYLSLSCEKELGESDLRIISNLSFVFAAFLVVKEKDGFMMKPLSLFSDNFVDEKISSLLKYSGKTNELFTRMMINVALLSSDFGYDDGIQLLDPVAGKGTTLFEAARYGYDAFGIEIDAKAVHASAVFIKQFLEAERYKHIADKRQVGGKSKREASYIQEFSFAATKEEFKDKEQRRMLGVVAGNSMDADKFYKKNSFHLLVGDLPYGIAHGNASGEKSKSHSRSPITLIEQCLPAWYGVMKKGGVLVLAWNSFVLSRSKLAQVVEEHGLEVLSDDPYENFEHMVDKSIKRDILVAIKTK